MYYADDDSHHPLINNNQSCTVLSVNCYNIGKIYRRYEWPKSQKQKFAKLVWMLKAKKTKKSICEHLGIAYNTKRLDNIMQRIPAKN